MTIIKNFLNNEECEKILYTTSTLREHVSAVGGLVNLERKRRNDIFTTRDMALKVDEILLKKVIDYVQDCKIEYRENYKIGIYNSDVRGFYNVHTDTQGPGDTFEYRKYSLVVSLTSDYEGGLFCIDGSKHKLVRGDAIIFKSSIPHGVEPVTGGVRKTLITFLFDESGAKHRLKYMNSIDNCISQLIPPDTRVSKTVDIDYSDKLWNHEGVFKHIKNNSSTLVITFAGMGDKDDKPTFIFMNFLKKFTNIDKLFLRDLSCNYYLKDKDKFMDIIGNIIPKYKRVVALGCSAGGFAAILFGHLFSFDKVLSFAPQTNLLDFEDTGNALHVRKRLSHVCDNNYMDLKNCIPFNCDVVIDYPSNENDERHALHVKHDKCTIIKHKTRNHRIALELRDSGILYDRIKCVL